jgi:hypothetical protein
MARKGILVRASVKRLLLLLAVAACDKDEDTAKVPEPAPSTLVAADAFSATDPQRPAGDLRGDLDAFTTVEECVAKRTASMDPLVGDGLGAIGYDTFLRDACRMLDAAKTNDPKKCDGIDASSMRGKCRSLVAITSGHADDCPLRADAEPRFGRDPTCVAAALRSPALCTGETRLHRSVCEALVLHDAKKCEPIVGADHDTCTRDASRYKSIIVGNAQIEKIAKTAAELEIHGSGRDDPPETKIDMGPELETGAVVILGATETRFDIGTVGITSATVKTVSPTQRTRLSFTVHTLAKGDAKIDRLELAVPGAIAVSCSPCDSIPVKVEKLDKNRGGEVTLSLEGPIGAAPNAFKIKARVATFVRDLVQR